METLEQKKNREMAQILKTICIISMLREWKKKQHHFEKLEKLEKMHKASKSHHKNHRKDSDTIINSLLFLLGIK